MTASGAHARPARRLLAPGAAGNYNLILMRKTLTKIGDSTGLIIDKPILQLMDLSLGDEVELDLVEGALVVRPASGRRATPAQRKAQIAALKERMKGDIGGTLRKLAK